MRPEVVGDYAVSRAQFNLLRLASSFFLHGSTFHLTLSLLGLWLFGAAVEGRLRPFLFLVLYVGGNLLGACLQLFVVGAAHPERMLLGDTGGLLAIAGAYFILFPFSTISAFFWWGFGNMGATECPARPIVLLYAGLEMVYGLVYKNPHSLGQFAPLSGFGLGMAVALLSGARRDDAEMSYVQAAVSDTKDYALLHFADLAILMQQPTEDMNLVMAYCEKALTLKTETRLQQCLGVLYQYSRLLVDRADPYQLAELVLCIPVSTGGLPNVFYLRLASRLEALRAYDTAAQLYRRACDLAPQEPDSEIALYRLGQLTQNALGNVAHARAIYQEMLRLFPNGRLVLEARRALQQH